MGGALSVTSMPRVLAVGLTVVAWPATLAVPVRQFLGGTIVVRSRMQSNRSAVTAGASGAITPDAEPMLRLAISHRWQSLRRW